MSAMSTASEFQEIRETKGERTRRNILIEARQMIDELGIAGVSQEAVARRVGLTQSALRHHFPTKEAMFDAIFDLVFSTFYHSAERIMLEPGLAPRERLMALLTEHLHYVVTGSDRLTQESFAHYLRNEEMLTKQSSWYHWIAGHYATLIGTIRPQLSEKECQSRALGLIAISIGAWTMIGRSRPDWPGLPGDEARKALLSAAELLIDA